jgi:hypothetical protein
VDFLVDNWPLLLPGAALWIGGWVQAVTLLGVGFIRNNQEYAWNALRGLVLAVFGMVYVSFWFTVKQPLSHIYFVLFPLIMTYSCYCWMFFKKKEVWRTVAKTFVILGVIFHFGYALVVAPHDSIYPGREKIQKAIDAKDYRIFGERRKGSLY